MGAGKLTAEAVQALWDVQHRPAAAGKWVAKMARRLGGDRWAVLEPYHLEDLAYDLGLRHHAGLLALAEWLAVEDRNAAQLLTFRRPRKHDRDLMLMTGWRPVEAAALLVQLEAVGVPIDVAPIVEAVLPRVPPARQMTSSELRVLWASRERLATQFQVVGELPADGDVARFASFKTARGYEAYWHSPDNGEAWCCVTGPRYRRRWRRDPGIDVYERRRQRLQAAKLAQLLEPQPDPTLLRWLDGGGEAVVIGPYAARPWADRRVYRVARQFRRENRYDFVQWPDPGNRAHDLAKIAAKKRHGVLFIDTGAGPLERGALQGAAGFSWREWRDAPPSWHLDFVWLAPPARRQGVLTAAWPRLVARFGDFSLEPPLSDEMRAFARARLTPGQQALHPGLFAPA